MIWHGIYQLLAIFVYMVDIERSYLLKTNALNRP